MPLKKKIKGVVKNGKARGRTFGFPTINIETHLRPKIKQGVYVCRLNIDDETYYGVMHYGQRPTFSERALRLEVHIFDFDYDVYGTEVTIDFYEFIRSTVRFTSKEKLIEQITKDLIRAREILKEQGFF